MVPRGSDGASPSQSNQGRFATSFQLHSTDPNSSARRGTLQTAHGSVETPTFMPVGTLGTVKGLEIEQVLATGAQVILGNTYHLALRPGEKTVEHLGGLHAFSGWDLSLIHI